MTDRVHSLTVVLDHDYRVDDVEAIIHALYMIKGVIKVEPNVADVTSLMAESRAQNELRAKIFAALK